MRPIAIGCTLHRLAAKLAGSCVMQSMGALLAPRQLGYGTPLGAEAAVHTARIYLQNLQPDSLILKLDFKNAFNCLRSDKMLLAVEEMAPELLPLVHSAYCVPSSLFIGNVTIPSSEGVQQGDPLGPLLFCLTIHHMVQQLRSEVCLFYLDDGTLRGCLDNVLHDLRNVERVAGDLGLQFKHEKSEVICEDLPALQRRCFVLPLACEWSVKAMPPYWALPLGGGGGWWRALMRSFQRRPRFYRSWGIGFGIVMHMMLTAFFAILLFPPRSVRYAQVRGLKSITQFY